MDRQQQVTLDVYTNSITAKFTLQPFVYQTLDYYKDKLEKEIVKQKKRVEKSRKPDKKKKLQEELENIQDHFNDIYDGGRN